MNARILPLIFFILALVFGHAQAAGVSSQLDNLFSEMSAYTEPGSYETQRRNGYQGGRFTYRNPIVNQNLIALELPSAKGGCGGIDVFGGSFSFVNSDQIIQLVRAVASNAKGYAFNVAMDNMCPGCIKWMNELQTKIQKLNGDLSNSCQLAQGLVNDANNFLAAKTQEDMQWNSVATVEGIGTDFGDLAKHIGNGATAVARMATANPIAVDQASGALVYKQLKENGVNLWFSSGDEELIETILSMTGSVVIGQVEPDSTALGNTPIIGILPGQLVTMAEIVEGAQNVKIYDCSLTDVPDVCRIQAGQTKTVNISSLTNRLVAAFTGPGGVISYIRLRQLDADITQEQKNLISAMPFSIGQKIFNLAPSNPNAAEALIRRYADAMATEYVWKLVQSSLDAARKTLATSTSPYKPQAITNLDAAYTFYSGEYETLVAKNGKLQEIETYYAQLLRNVDVKQYVNTSDSKQKIQ